MTALSQFDDLALVNLCELLRHAPALPRAERPVLWLGAGASAHAGVPLGDALLERVLGPAPAGAWGSLQYRFDATVGTLAPRARRARMLGHLTADLTADSPYLTVVRLLGAGAVGAVVTFNVDDLLDAAVDKVLPGGVVRVDCVAETPAAVATRLDVEADDDRPRLFKLHGTVETGLNLFTSAEISAYEPELAAVVERLSRRPAVVCGYSFTHLNVLRAFSSDPAPFFYVNPSFPQLPALLSLLTARGGVLGSVASGAAGDFAAAMGRVAAEVLP